MAKTQKQAARIVKGKGAKRPPNRKPGDVRTKKGKNK